MVNSNGWCYSECIEKHAFAWVVVNAFPNTRHLNKCVLLPRIKPVDICSQEEWREKHYWLTPQNKAIKYRILPLFLFFSFQKLLSLRALLTSCTTTSELPCKSLRHTTHHLFPHTTLSIVCTLQIHHLFSLLLCSLMASFYIAPQLYLSQFSFNHFQSPSTRSALNDPFPFSCTPMSPFASHPAFITPSYPNSIKSISATRATHFDKLFLAQFLNASYSVFHCLLKITLSPNTAQKILFIPPLSDFDLKLFAKQVCLFSSAGRSFRASLIRARESLAKFQYALLSVSSEVPRLFSLPPLPGCCTSSVRQLNNVIINSTLNIPVSH